MTWFCLKLKIVPLSLGFWTESLFSSRFSLTVICFFTRSSVRCLLCWWEHSVSAFISTLVVLPSFIFKSVQWISSPPPPPTLQKSRGIRMCGGRQRGWWQRRRGREDRGRGKDKEKKVREELKGESQKESKEDKSTSYLINVCVCVCVCVCVRLNISVVWQLLVFGVSNIFMRQSVWFLVVCCNWLFIISLLAPLKITKSHPLLLCDC